MGLRCQRVNRRIARCFSIRSFGSFDGTWHRHARRYVRDGVSVSALSDHLMGRFDGISKPELERVSVSALSDHLMGRTTRSGYGCYASVSVSALSDHLMGRIQAAKTMAYRLRFSIRSFGSFDGTGDSAGRKQHNAMFQYPLFRII